MHILDILIGKPEVTPAKSGLTGHFKKPVTAAQVTPDGLTNDHIGDLDNHGGVDQAVYIFTDPDRHWWAETLKRDTPPGFFGENLLISDLSSADLCIGDRFTTDTVTLEITSPRIPCTTYAAHIGSPQAIKQFYAAKRPGAYARVITSGIVTKGDALTYTPYTGDRITMIDETASYLRKYKDDADLARRLNVPAHFKIQALARARGQQS